MTDAIDFDEQSVSCSVPQYCWLPVDTLLPGLTLARRVVVHERDRLLMTLAEGTLLTEGIIAQMMIKAVECVAVLNEHPPAANDYLALKKAHEARVQQVFGCRESQLSEDCRPLFDALIATDAMR